VKATTTKKKKIQRGNNRGSVRLNSRKSPPQPIARSRKEVGRNESGEGVPAGFMEWEDYKRRRKAGN
jgi:hypothetical protein